MFWNKEKQPIYNWFCPKHGKQSTILNFEYGVNKKFCFECIAEKLTELDVKELVKKEIQ